MLVKGDGDHYFRPLEQGRNRGIDLGWMVEAIRRRIAG
jgi:hypothetical protein